jgi:mono/diheme cytochrome c family protein
MAMGCKYIQQVSVAVAGRVRFSVGSPLPNVRNHLRAFLLVLVVTLLSTVNPAEAQKGKQKDQLLDAMALADDSSVICSIYGNQKKYYAKLARLDGSKLLGKNSWSLKEIKKKLPKLEESIKSLAASGERKNRKKLKKAKANKKQLVAAKKQILACEKARKQDSAANPIRFEHVAPILEKRCMNCHGVLGWRNEESFYLESGRVVPTLLEESPLYNFLSSNPEGYTPAYMPKGLAPLPEVEILLLSRWILNLSQSGGDDDTTPDGPEAEGRALYKTYCASCHGALYTSAKWGATEAQIRAAIRPGGIPQMRHLELSAEQIKNIALALSKVSPPVEGTLSVRSVADTAEGGPGEARSLQFEVVLTGKSSKPFSVGFVSSNGTALAESDFVFAADKLDFQGLDGERKLISVQVIGDAFEELNETVYLDIGGVSYGGVRVATSSAFASILNDDTLVQVLPPLFSKLRVAYGFNGDYSDAVRLSDAQAQADAVITPDAKVGTGALELDVGPDHILVPGRNLQNLSSFTFTAWVYSQSSSTSARLFDFGNSASSYIYFMPRDGANRCRFEIRSGASIYTLQCNPNLILPAARWVHLATTFNSETDEMKIFFDGVQVASRSMVDIELAGIVLSDNKIGESRVAGNVDFAGRLDEVAIWDGALSPEMIAEVMAMTQSIVINSNVEVRFDGQLLGNSSILNFGQVEIGSEETHALTISNLGAGGLVLTGTPLVSVLGRNAGEFRIQHQPWPWQTRLGSGSFTAFSVRFSPTTPGEKSATISISNSDFKSGNYAFGARGSATGEPIEDAPSGGGAESPQLLQGRDLYNLNCASCHGALATSAKRGVTLERLTAALNPATGIAQMRQLGLNSEQVSNIVLALNSALPPPPKLATATETGVSLGTAGFVASVLSEVFLPDDRANLAAEDLAIKARIDENILGIRANNTFVTGRVTFMGGRCERFDTLCHPEGVKAPQAPSPNIVRTGLIIRACDEVVSLDRAVDNALAKISRSAGDRLDKASVQALYDLFAPGKEIPAYLREMIASFPNELPTFNARDRWRYALNVVCVSDAWEAR